MPAKHILQTLAVIVRSQLAFRCQQITLNAANKINAQLPLLMQGMVWLTIAILLPVMNLTNKAI